MPSSTRRRSYQSPAYRGPLSGTPAAAQKRDFESLREDDTSTQAPLTPATIIPERAPSDTSEDGETVVTQGSQTAMATDLSRFRQAQDEYTADHSLHRRHSLAICASDEASRTLSAMEERYFSWP